MYKRTPNAALKYIITFTCGIAAFIGVFLLDRLLINRIVSQFTFDHNILLLIKIGLWLISISWTLAIALFVGYLVSLLLARIFGID